MMSETKAFFHWVWDQIDPLAALLIALVCSILGLVNIANMSLLIPAILTTLTIIAFTLIRERSGRELLRKKLDDLIVKFDSPTADTIFSTRTSEIKVIQDADQEILIIQETGTLLIETNKNQLVSLLSRGKRLRMLLASTMDVTTRIIAFRNANLDQEGIMQRARMFQYQIADLVNKARNNTEQLEVRFTPYPIDITCVFADPQHPNDFKRKAIVRLAGFQVSYEDKLDMVLNFHTSPNVFQHYNNHAQKLFEHSSKIVLLTGAPSSGKTTIFRRLVNSIADNANIFYILSPVVVDNEAHKSFEAITSDNKQPIKFAERLPDGDYRLVPDVWDKLTVHLEKALEAKKIIILDEIGPLQLNDDKFRGFITKIFADHDATMFATLALDDNKHPLLSQVRQHYRSTVLQLYPKQNEKRIEDLLLQELQASLRVMNLISSKHFEV